MTGRGRLLVFEGIDGCGKSTQARRVAAARAALSTFEPGDTALGEALRAVVVGDAVSMTPLAEVLVMAADRSQHVATVIEPALAAGRDVVCDRFSGSTLAYQGYGRGISLDRINAVLDVATDGVAPDLTILLDCAVEVAAGRRGVAGRDRFEGEHAGFLERVRQGYLALAATCASWAVVDGSGPLDEVSRAVDGVLAAASW